MTDTTTTKTLYDVLRNHVVEHPNGVALRFIEPQCSSVQDATTLSFLDLHRVAANIASRLIPLTEPGDRVVILYPPGLEYVTALFGCLYAGLVAVPAYPPMTTAGDERLTHIVESSEPTLVLTSDLLAPLCEACGLANNSSGVTTVIVDDVSPPPPGTDEMERPSSSSDDLALLQYTSGSTGLPRGVMLSHANILANVHSIMAHMDGSDADIGAFWLPPYHDMGLIGGIFTSIVYGTQSVLMSPITFLQDPLLWLEAISHYRATFSAAPNFAYELCVRKADDSRLARLDLQSWRIAINGAEPARYATMDSFSERYKPVGFDRTAFAPCYGLAEATLMVSGTPAGTGVRTAHLPGQRDEDIQPSSHKREGVVSVGTTTDGGLVAIVDAERSEKCPDGRIGEIWFSGPSVAQGYWRNSQETEEVFGGVLADEPHIGPFLRTGDLGIVIDGKLYVTGRSKDLIIVRGQNYYPHDIELIASQADPRVRAGCVAAFEAWDKDRQRIVVVAETTADAPVDEVARNIRQAVAQSLRLSITDVALIERGASLKTSSGKIRRSATRDAYVNGALSLIGEANLKAKTKSMTTDRPTQIEEALRTAMRQILDVEELSVDDDFFAYGGDSLGVVELVATVEEQGVQIEPEDVYQFPTARLLGQEVVRRGADGSSPKSGLAVILRGEIPRVADADTYELSPIQRRWATDYLGDRSKTWGNLSLRIPLPDGGHLETLRRAVDNVCMSHESLRTSFPLINGVLRQQVHDSTAVPIEEFDLTGVSPDEVAQEASKIAASEAQHVFDLEQGPAIRGALVRLNDSTSEFVLTIHHMHADGWSLMELREQLSNAYINARSSKELNVVVPSIRYRDYAAWMNGLEKDKILTASRAYWLDELDGDLPVTMPVDSRLARDKDTRGANVMHVLPTELAMLAKKAAVDNRMGLSAVLFGTFFWSVQQYTGGKDIIIGTPLAGRDRRDIKDVVGMFINLVPIRIRFRHGWEMGDVITATRDKLLGAVTHQRYQLDNIVGDLGIEREPHCFPITNTFFTRIAMGQQEIGHQTGARTMGDMPIDVRYQLMFYAYDFADGLVLDCRYRRNLFSQQTICTLLDRYVELLASAVS